MKIRMTVRTSVAAATAVVGAATFAMLYGGLVALAREAGMETWQTWLYPLAIDGLTLAAYVATLRLRAWGLVFAWFVVGVGTALSFAGQWLHATAASDWAWAAPVQAAPAVSLALAWHLLWLVLHRDVKTVAQEQEAVEAIEETAAEVVEDPSKVGLEEAVAILVTAREKGHELTGAEMARYLGLHNAGTPSGNKTGQRWLRRAEGALAAAA